MSHFDVGTLSSALPLLHLACTLRPPHSASLPYFFFCPFSLSISLLPFLSYHVPYSTGWAPRPSSSTSSTTLKRERQGKGKKNKGPFHSLVHNFSPPLFPFPPAPRTDTRKLLAHCPEYIKVGRRPVPCSIVDVSFARHIPCSDKPWTENPYSVGCCHCFSDSISMQVWLRMWSCSSLSSPSRMPSLPDQRQICGSNRPSFKFSANLRVDPETEDTEDTTSQPYFATSSDAVLLDTFTYEVASSGCPIVLSI